jgi:hypothetical protein
MKTFIACCLVLLAAAAAQAQAFAVAAHAEPPPGDLADPIEALMAAGGQHVGAGGAALDFWWVKTLPLRSETSDVSWASVAEGTLVGAVTLSAPYPDAYGQMVRAGIYTLRSAVQPPIGDRRGTSSAANVLLLAPVADDDKTDALGHDDVVALARQTAGVSHPATWRIELLDAAGTPGSTQTTDAGETVLIVALPASRDGMDAGTLTFGLVLAGTTQR